jgi:hypothetical protein
VTPTANDSIEISDASGGGQATLGGRVTVIMTGTFTVGTSFTLLHADAGRFGTTFAFTSIMFLSGGGNPICPVIVYHDDPNTGSDVTLKITSCLSSGGDDDP